jgi:DnaJ-class molecular chaperone
LIDSVFGPNYYDLLAIEPNAPPEKIKAIYRLRSRQAHPDRSGGNEEWQKKLNAAYEVLSDPEKRREYNDNLGLPTRSRPLKPGQPIYAEIQVKCHNQTQDVPFEFKRWEPCARCWGEGCPRCRGKGKTLETVTLTVTIPASVSQVVVESQGTMAEPAGSRGDLVLYVVWR